MLKGHIPYLAKVSLIWQRMILVGVAAQCYVNGAIEILCKYLQSARRKYIPAGRQINFEGLAFVSTAILRQNSLRHAVSQLCLPFPLNNSQIFETKVL